MITMIAMLPPYTSIVPQALEPARDQPLGLQQVGHEPHGVAAAEEHGRRDCVIHQLLSAVRVYHHWNLYFVL